MVEVSRRQAIKSGAVTSSILLAGCLGGSNSGASYPSENITLISNYPAGSGTYALAVKVASVMSNVTGVGVEVEAIGGGAGLRGLGELMNRPADGYTFSTAYTPSQPLAALINNPGYDINDLTGITDGGFYTWSIIANPKHEFESFQGMVDRYNDGEFHNLGALGFGHSWHIGCCLIRKRLPWDWDTLVSFDGANDSIRGVAAGEVPVGTATTTPVVPAEKDGIIDALACTTSNGDSFAPKIPAWVDDLGYTNMDMVEKVRYMFLAPPGLSDDLRSKAIDMFTKTIENEGFQQWAKSNRRHADVQNKGDEVDQLMKGAQKQVKKTLDLEELLKKK